MLVLRFWLASDIGIIISIIGIIIPLIPFYFGNKKKDKYIINFVNIMSIIAIFLLVINYIDIKNNYIKIPGVRYLTVDSAKLRLIENGVNIDNVIFNSISSNSLPAGVTNVIDVEPAEGKIVNIASVISISYEEGAQNETETGAINPPKVNPSEELINAINEQLSDEGKTLDKEDLRAFICMLNEDYELISEDCLIRNLETFINIDGSASSLLVGIDIADDHMSSISAIYGAFSREKDSMFVEYWITRFEELKEKIFLHEDMESIYQEIDELGIDLYLTFCRGKPIQVENEIISINSLREETVLFVQSYICYDIALYLVNIHGQNSQQYLEMEDPTLGENVLISVDTICDELLESTDGLFNEIVYKVQTKPNA